MSEKLKALMTELGAGDLYDKYTGKDSDSLDPKTDADALIAKHEERVKLDTDVEKIKKEADEAGWKKGEAHAKQGFEKMLMREGGFKSTELKTDARLEDYLGFFKTKISKASTEPLEQWQEKAVALEDTIRAKETEIEGLMTKVTETEGKVESFKNEFKRDQAIIKEISKFKTIIPPDELIEISKVKEKIYGKGQFVYEDGEYKLRDKENVKKPIYKNKTEQLKFSELIETAIDEYKVKSNAPAQPGAINLNPSENGKDKKEIPGRSEHLEALKQRMAKI